MSDTPIGAADDPDKKFAGLRPGNASTTSPSKRRLSFLSCPGRSDIMKTPK